MAQIMVKKRFVSIVLVFCFMQRGAAQLTPELVAKTCARTIGLKIYSTLCHELGHAAAAKASFGCPIDVHLGSAQAGTEPLLAGGGISVDGVDLYEAYARFTPPQLDSLTQEQRAKLVAVYMAGGLSGIFGYWLMRAGVLSAQGMRDTKELLHRSVVFDGIVAHQLFAMLYPYKNYDGAKICDLLGIYVPNEARNSAGLALFVRYLLQVAATMHVYAKSGMPLKPWDAAIVALPNVLLPGLTSTADF